MKTFRITADALFQAEDIDDAFLALAGHFLALVRHGVDCPTMIELGRIDVRPARKVTKRCKVCGHTNTMAETSGEEFFGSLGRCAGCFDLVEFEEVPT